MMQLKDEGKGSGLGCMLELRGRRLGIDEAVTSSD